MAQTTGPWRVKGVDRQTRKLARDAAAKSGLSMGAWIDRTIKSEAGIPLRENAEPLVTEFLKSARGETRKRAEPFLTGKAETAESQTDGAQTGASQTETPPGAKRRTDKAPTTRPPSDKQPLIDPRTRYPRVNPAVAAASAAALRNPGSGVVRGAIGGVVAIALLIGGYVLVTQFPKGSPVMFAGSSKLGDDASTERNRSESGPQTPIQKLTEAAKSGDARAQHDLGLMYVQGNGVAKDPRRGAVLLEQSAGSGLPKAQYHVGVLYEKGLGVPKDDQTAFQWYQRAAKQGHVRAQHSLGTFYAEGRGASQNYAEAARWFSQASRGGLAESHYSLGMIHELGLGVEKNERKAAAFYRSALAAGSAQAAAKLEELEPALQETSKKVEETLATKVAPRDNEQSASATQGRVLSPAGIINLQRLLARLDLSPGPANGILGEETVEAIKLYQRFAGLPVDGKPSVELLRDLRQVVGAMETDTPAPGTGSTTTAR